MPWRKRNVRGVRFFTPDTEEPTDGDAPWTNQRLNMDCGMRKTPRAHHASLCCFLLPQSWPRKQESNAFCYIAIELAQECAILEQRGRAACKDNCQTRISELWLMEGRESNMQEQATPRRSKLR